MVVPYHTTVTSGDTRGLAVWWCMHAHNMALTLVWFLDYK